MVSTENLLNYQYWIILFAVNTNSSGKHLGDVISQNEQPIDFLSQRLNNLQHKYTMTDKKNIIIIEPLHKLCGLLIGYKINVLSYHKNMVYVATLSRSYHMMHWRLIIE